MKVTLTASGDLDPSAKFFTAGDTAKIVYTRDAMLPPPDSWTRSTS